MQRLGVRYVTRLGNNPVDFIVEKNVADDGSTCWYVDAAVRQIEYSLTANGFDVSLLDKDRRPLASTPVFGNHGALIESHWGAVRSAHKPTVFASSGGEPTFVAFSMGKRSKVIPVDTSQAQAPTEYSQSDQDIPQQVRRPDPLGERCCVGEDALKTPSGEQPTTVHRLLNSDRSVAGYTVRPRPFVREATFIENDQGCKCACCEYREQIKGIFRLRAVPNGVYLNWAPLLDFEQPPSDPDDIQRGIYPSESTYTDVSMPVPREPGNPIKVGRRNDLGTREESPWERVNQDYRDCGYWLDYYPKLFSVPPGKLLEVDASFRAAIVDVCNHNEMKAGWNEWSWKFNGDPARRVP